MVGDKRKLLDYVPYKSFRHHSQGDYVAQEKHGRRGEYARQEDFVGQGDYVQRGENVLREDYVDYVRQGARDPREYYVDYFQQGEHVRQEDYVQQGDYIRRENYVDYVRQEELGRRGEYARQEDFVGQGDYVRRGEHVRLEDYVRQGARDFSRQEYYVDYFRQGEHVRQEDYVQQGFHYVRPEDYVDYVRRPILPIQQSSNNLNNLTFVFTKQYYHTMPKDKNLVFSPLSIQVVLGLIAAGCKGAGHDHLLSFLKQDSVDLLNDLFSYFVTTVFASSSSKVLSLNFVNGIWVDQSLNLKQPFKKVVDDVYKAALTQVDFKNKHEEARTNVNLWAKKETRGLIKEILPLRSVDKNTRVALGNAIYFKGAWENKFDASMTKKHQFYLLDGGTVKIPFMTSRRKQLIGVYDGFKVLQLAYGIRDNKRRFSMCIFLPDAKDGLPLLVDKLSSEPGFVNRHLPCIKVDVGEFLIPKFKISFGFEATGFLKGLGLGLPPVTEIVEVDELEVKKIYHKSYIEVNEEGTEAAAVTVATMGFGCGMRTVVEEIDFVADHPFVFLIRDDVTGVVMFIGTLLNPCVSSA